jgi:hypothetical protein
MKKAHAVLFLFLFCSFTSICHGSVPDTALLPQGKGALIFVLKGLKEEQANNRLIINNLVAAQNDYALKAPMLTQMHDEKAAEAENIKQQHNNKHPEGSEELKYWNGRYAQASDAASRFLAQRNMLQQAIDEAQKQKDMSDAQIKELQQQMLSIGNVPDWRCFFDNDCADRGADPVTGKGTVVVPNGAPFIFTKLSEEYKNRYKLDNKTVPAPFTLAPQKGMIESATEKVRSLFRGVINNSIELKKRITAVNAVRG